MGSILHIVLACIAAFVGLALVLAVFYAVSFAVFGTYAVLLGIHPALGIAYAGLLWVVMICFAVHNTRKGAGNGA